MKKIKSSFNFFPLCFEQTLLLMALVLLFTLCSDIFVCSEVYGETVKEKIRRTEERKEGEKPDSLNQTLLRKKELVNNINKYLKGDINFFDNYTSDLLLFYAEELYDYAELTYREQIEEYNRKLLEQPDNEIPPPKSDFKFVIAFLDEIIENRKFDELIDRFIYLRGICYEEMGDREKAALDYENLLHNYSFSPLVSETIFRLGEFYFETNQTAEAIATYELIMNHKESIFFDKALYKLGWSYYKTLNFKKAITFFLMVAEQVYRIEDIESKDTLQVEQKSSIKKANLADEALTYAALSFASYGFPNDTKDLISGTKPFTEKLYQKLGEAYFYQAKFEESVIIYKKAISLFPFSYEAMEMELKIISIYKDSLALETNAFVEKEKFIYTYSPESEWFQKNKNNKETEKIQDLLDPMIIDTAAYYLKVARERGDRVIYGKIADLYKKYLTIYGTARKSNYINYALAELYYEMALYKEAAIEYEKSAWAYKDSEFKEKAAYAVILTYEKIRSNFSGDKEAAALIAESMLKATEKYISAFPGESKTALVLIKKGEIYFDRGEYDKAIELFIKAESLNIDSENKIILTKYISDSYFNQKDYVNAEKKYERLSLMAERALRTQLKEKADEMRIVCILNIGANLKGEGDIQKAAIEFERAFMLSKNMKDSEYALGEVLKISIEGRKWDLFDEKLKVYEDKFPQSERILIFLKAAGKISEDNFDFAAAATYYDLASEKSTQSTEKENFLLLAALYYGKARNTDKSIEIYTRISKGDYISGMRKLEYLFKIGELLAIKGEQEKAKAQYMEIVTLHESLEQKKEMGNKYYYGKSRLILIEDDYMNYKKLELVHPFEENFKIKHSSMQNLIKELIEVTKLDIHEFTAASLYKTGQVFENFRESIIKSPVPPEFSEAEKEEFAFMLEERAFPYEEKAKQIYEKNIQIARDKGVTNQYVDMSYSRLAEVSPAIYKREETGYELEMFFSNVDFMKEFSIDAAK